MLGTCGKDGRRCWNRKQWTLRAERRQNGEGATALVVDLAKAFEKVQRSVVWKWAMYFDFPQRALRVLCVCVILQDLLTKPVTRQRLDRLRPPLGLVMKTPGDDDENFAPMQTWARHLRHIGHLRPVKICRFGEMFPRTVIAHLLTSAHETAHFLVVRSVSTTLVCSVNRAKLCSVYVPRDDECGCATNLTKRRMVRHVQCVHGMTRVCFSRKCAVDDTSAAQSSNASIVHIHDSPVGR